ncbi:unnamed protein product [Cyprideis torosa]|uniref:Uncharacterized protein n=1 Tax=Cyprideis torosa TaxID=163714 RepID=A0A7R8ZU25_9CRUS|nr:unnamed protein product [Cyprideis torosa]CAG0899500.1 unnamed protein product [Cyprideis torosa]
MAQNVFFSPYSFYSLQRLVPYLRNQSEDCLYLNIYAPVTGNRRNLMSVVVFIHGESFDWGTGNVYDGRTLAGYGQIVVVTFNYRLGALGYLRPNAAGGSVANFALLDQIAALNWIKENIEQFGGDPRSVTVMGHGAGAVATHLLMTSPVAHGNGKATGESRAFVAYSISGNTI